RAPAPKQRPAHREARGDFTGSAKRKATPKREHITKHEKRKASASSKAWAENRARARRASRAQTQILTRASRPSRADVAIVGAFVVLIGVIIAALAYLLQPTADGQIRLRTLPRDAAVFLDHERVQTSASPFILPQVSPNEAHTL